MKLKTGFLLLGVITASAWAQNPDIIQNTRDTMHAVQQKKAMDSNAALAASQGNAGNPGQGRPAYVSAGNALPDSACCKSGTINSWREDMVAAGDMNCFSPYGVYNAPCMPWEDKGTYAQVVEVLAASSNSGSPLPSSLPNTATRWAVGLPLVLIALLALTLWHQGRATKFQRVRAASQKAGTSNGP